MGLMKRVLTQGRDPDKPAPGPASGVRSGKPPAAGQKTPVTAEARRDSILSDEHATPIHPEMITRMVLRELNDIPASIEAPAHIFAMLKRNLTLQKAALLLPDPEEQVYVPWTITGFDLTTQRRLHISEETAYSLFPNRVPVMLLFSGDETRQLQNCFSVREFGTIKRIVLCSFFYEARLLAILVITETPFFALDPTILQVMYSAFEDGISRLLFSSREARISRIQLPLLFTYEQLSPMAHEALRENPDRQPEVLFLQFNPETAVARILEQARESDRYRVRQDVLRILNTLIAGLGKVFVLPKNQLLLMRTEQFPERAGTETDRNPHLLDVELLVHQINQRLKQFFTELQGYDNAVSCRLVIYPRDSADMEELTASFG